MMRSKVMTLGELTIKDVPATNDNEHISLRVYMTVIAMARQVVEQERRLEGLLYEIEEMAGKHDSYHLYNQGDVAAILSGLKQNVEELKQHVESLI